MHDEHFVTKGDSYMLDVNLLGTGGMVPLPGRYLTSLAVRYAGETMIVDCGEGTQMAAREAGISLGKIGVICITHFHADHIAGLPGLLLTIGNAERTEPLTIIGPKHIGHVADCLRIIAPQLPYEIKYVETDGGQVYKLDSLIISAQAVKHRIPCFAYKFQLSRAGKFNAQKASEREIPVRYWSLLQRGQTVELDGQILDPSQFTGAPRRGLKICYATDLRPSQALVDFARDADLFICEGMYGDPELQSKARERYHSVFSEAAAMAKQADVRELWLTHFSPSMPKPQEYLHIAREIFSNTHIDKKSAQLRFEDK